MAMLEMRFSIEYIKLKPTYLYFIINPRCLTNLVMWNDITLTMHNRQAVKTPVRIQSFQPPNGWELVHVQVTNYSNSFILIIFHIN